MKVKFLGQPFASDAQAGREIVRALGRQERNKAFMVTAWAKRSGLGRIVGSLKEFRKNGGIADLIVGLDEGGASREGLELALELFSSVHVFHDPARTFHPKIYVVEGAENATVVVGSSNATRGGFFTNYEASICVDLTLLTSADRDFLESLHAYRDRLLALDRNCIRLDSATLRKLETDGRIRLGSERRHRSAERGGAHGEIESIFGGGVSGLHGAPASEVDTGELPDTDSLPLGPVEHDAAYPFEGASLSSDIAASDEEGTGGTHGTLGFWKKLSSFDVSTSSAPGQIIIPIRFRDFFEPLTLEFDRTASGGPRQYNRHFGLTFVDGPFTKTVSDARVILYEPASDHPRPNIELRFAFRDRDVFNRLSKNDVLVFRQTDGHIVVEKREGGSMGSGRFAHLSE